MPPLLRTFAMGASTLALLAAVPSGASPAHAGSPPSHEPADSRTDPSGSVTLVTGDVVTVSETPGGRYAATVEAGPGRDTITFNTFEVDGELRVVPGDAIPYLSAGRLDIDLFEVSSLLKDGYGDTDRADLPLIVEYAAGARTALRVPGVTPTHDLASIGGGALRVTHDGTANLWQQIAGATAGAESARFAGGIKRIWLDGKVQAALDQSTGQIGAPAAWAQGLDGHGVDVAVLDTGVDPAHPDFAGRIGATRDFTGTGTIQDGHGHGTHVAGTILGTGAASEPLRRGVAPGAELMAGKVLNDYGWGLDSWIIDGMEWAVGSGADIVNMSFGGGARSDATDPMSMAVDHLAEESGTLFVVAAGNEGSESSVVSPGNASMALTVGAVDRNGDLAPFSSRGPRLGDFAIKPEITAPGVDIAAPRATGTTMGTPVDDYYTRASGTSMATPHVAGAAAILLQQHPDWDGQRIKRALVSSAVPNPKRQPFEQGNGMVQVDRAISQPVTSDGVLDLGLFEEGKTPAAATDLQYVNTSEQDVTLNLTMQVANARTGEPEDDAVTLDRDTVTVPAGGVTTVAVHVDPAKMSRGRYAGYVTAVGADGVELSTALGTTLLPPTYHLTLKGLDVHGQASPVAGITLFGTSNESEDVVTWISPRTESITLALPADTYILTALIEHEEPLKEVTYLVDPELEVDSNMTVELDARTGTPIEIVTPQPSEQLGILSYFAHRVTTAGRNIGHGVMHFGTVQHVNVSPTDPPARGDFEFSSRWQLAAPMVTAMVDRVSGDWDINLLKFSPAFDGSRKWPLAYGGTGSADELARVAGKAVIIEGDLALPEPDQIENAARAGAAAVLVVRPIEQTAWTEWTPVGERLPLPAFAVATEDGQELLAKAKTGTSTLNLTLATASPYLYDVFDVHRDAIPDQIVHRITTTNSKRLKVSYPDMGGFQWEQEQRFGWRPWQDFAWFDSHRQVRTSRVRTEWISAGDSRWQHHVDHEYAWGPEGPVDLGLTGPVEQYVAGTGEESWFSPIVRPAAPGTPGAPVSTRTATRLALNIPELVDADQNYGYMHASREADKAHVAVWRDGMLLGESNSGVLTVDTEPGRAGYRVLLDASRTSGEWTAATRTRTEWRFTSQAPADAHPAALPMLQADYRVGRVQAEHSDNAKLPLGVTFRNQRGGPAITSSATVEMSTDSGTTWITTPLKRTHEGVEVLLPVGRARAVSLRVVAATPDGQELRQTVIDALQVR